MRVLVIEDKPTVVKDIAFCLKVRYPETEVISMADGKKGIDLVEGESPDLVMVDSSLPGTNSLDLIRKIREFADVPLIILCDAESDLDKAKGLEAGADEYINKPFSPIELLARVNALLRRTRGASFRPDHTVSLGNGLTVDLSKREVSLSGKPVRLTRIEFELLSLLVRNEGRVLTHQTLLEKVWGPEYANKTEYIEANARRIRDKLEEEPDNPRMVLSEPGIGYKFVGH